MAYEQILYDVSDQVATITLNRPDKLNAWTATMEDEVRSAVTAAAGDDGVRAIVLTGAGRGFCAGADMSLLSGIVNGQAPRRTPVGRCFLEFPAVPKPTIAAINGPAVGLGLILPLYCDLRIASDSARFGTAFAKRGLIAEYGLAWLLPRLVGPGNALDLLFSARVIDAAEARRIGLVNRVLPEAEFAGGVRTYATELASQVSPRSLRVIKQQVYEAPSQSLLEAQQMAEKEMFACFGTEDFREGVAHYVEKRQPAFTGR